MAAKTRGAAWSIKLGLTCLYGLQYVAGNPVQLKGREDGVSDDVAFTYRRRLVEVVKKNERGDFEDAEHRWLGDSINLQWSDGNTYQGADLPLALPNGLNLTYGEINGLGGDFYATVNPISDGETLDQQMEYFLAAFDALATDTSRQPDEAQEILELLQEEVDTLNAAIEMGEDPSVAYSTLPDQTASFEEITITRGSDYPSYLGLALINYDHFGEDARTAYNAAHYAALTQAAGGAPNDLNIAYAMNAFADHFLEDSFSAGHARTPRRLLHGSLAYAADACAKYMHDEDNAIGLQVSNPAGQSWTMYGDKRLLDDVDQQNNILALEAIQASADEIFTAWQTGTVPDIGSFAAWNLACTLDSARSTTQALAPLFMFGDGPPRRADIDERRVWEFTTSYTFATTVLSCSTSGLWSYPITLDP
ncbi:hypothetical protein F4777DRAFT_566875 [Nemania sp. FL0916]|nr:hypothetical protein F4777DRAFT_566875 [Nemania sp. FL0916]